MYSVVLADDEPLIIKGLLKMVDWEQLNAEVVGTAKNGQQLIEQIQRLAPDIIISDISMPKQSGIDVVRYIKENGLRSKVIFLSAYQEFDYAKQALKYGVVEYLLKPVAKDELEGAVVKAKEALEDKLSLEYLKEDKESPQAVFKAATSEYGFKELYKKFEDMGMPVSGVCYVGVCFAVVGMEKEKSKSQGERELLRFTVFKRIEEYVAKEKLGFCLKREVRYCSMILFYPKEESKRCYGDVSSVLERIEHKYGVCLAAGIGKRVDSLSQLKFAWKTASFACKLYYFQPDKITVYDHINKEYDKSFDDYNAAYQEIVRSILHQEPGWREKLPACIGLIGEIHYGNRVVAENRCVALLMELMRELCNYCQIGEADRSQYEHFVSQVRDLETFHELESYVTDYITQFIEKRVFPNMGGENETVRNIKLYIREHYGQDINLKILSKEFFMNPYYFSAFFKQKTGKNFKDYLASVRMEKALELLLADNGLSVQELAKKVGYNDTKAFSEKFKQYYGESPVSYKRVNR